jgi:hypothetical protein
MIMMAEKSEAEKAGLVPPTDPVEFEKWRKSLDPNFMGFNGKEVTTSDGTNSKKDVDPV